VRGTGHDAGPSQRLPHVDGCGQRGHGQLGAVIEPEQTRLRLVRGLEMLKNKRQTNPPKKHGNIPL
jgi:acetyl-CoA carboxylase carboxyltransferase component